MYPLFLETRAVRQIRQWCLINGKNEEDCQVLINAAYRNACGYVRHRKQEGGFDGWLFARHVQLGNVDSVDINRCFEWAKTPEGQEIWSNINAVRLP